jgi:hypothetical protein
MTVSQTNKRLISPGEEEADVIPLPRGRCIWSGGESRPTRPRSDWSRRPHWLRPASGRGHALQYKCLSRKPLQGALRPGARLYTRVPSILHPYPGRPYPTSISHRAISHRYHILTSHIDIYHILSSTPHPSQSKYSRRSRSTLWAYKALYYHLRQHHAEDLEFVYVELTIQGKPGASSYMLTRLSLCELTTGAMV